MNPPQFYFAAVFAAILCLPSSLRAQQAAVNVRFRIFGWDEASSDLNYWQAKDLGVVIYQDTRSVFYKYAGPAQIIFYRIVTGSDGNIVRVPAAQANLEGEGPWPLLIFFKTPGSPGKYSVDVLPDDLKSFPPGSYKFANFTNGPISGKLGPQSFQLQTRDIRLLRGQTEPGRTTLFAEIDTGGPDGKTPVYTNNWAAQPQMRTLVFVKQSSDSSTGIVARRIIESTVFPPASQPSSPLNMSGR
jgi:hypothetical protein